MNTAKPNANKESKPETTTHDFGETLRHEVNNPLTGILGNAELLLAKREQLDSRDVERLETIAELAVRLRDTVRRLSSTLQNQPPSPSEPHPAQRVPRAESAAAGK